MDLQDARPLTGDAGTAPRRTHQPTDRPNPAGRRPPAVPPMFQSGKPERPNLPAPPSTLSLPPFTDC